MRKSVTKRFKITKRGKFLRRRTGQNHFNAKQSRRIQRKKRKNIVVLKTVAKKMRAYM
ncbi:MAG: 50S ribosomal protein L35 [Candidatus Colwellbacteria bacterium]|nr:50S ribosomal protein L35 [Candidatus Colwellbacteria bacterium]